MTFLGGKPTSYYGRSSYKYVEPILRGEKELLIVSPYIDAYYTNYLLSHARGKRIRIISSAIGKDDAKRLSNRRRAWPIIPALLLFLGNVMLVYTGIILPAFLAASGLIILLLIALVALKKKLDISLKVPKSFVHAKLYVGNNMAVEGSANLTFAGMHKNVEHVSVTRDPDEINELRKQFWKIWNEE